MRSIEAHTRDHSLLDSASMGRREYWLWLLASGGTLIDGLSVFSLGIAMPLVTSRFALNPLMVGLIGSALVLGAVFGAVLGGPSADCSGRKPAYLIDVSIIAAGAFVSAAAGAPQWVLLGQLVVATIALQSVGMLLGGATDLAILRIWSSSEDWRLMIGAIGATALVFFLLRFWLPESPRWLLHHEHGRASARGTSAGSPRPGYALLFSRRYRTRTMLVSLPWFLMDIATYGVGLFTTIILGAISFSSDARGPLAAEFSNAEGTAAIDVFLLIGFLLGIWAVPRFGRIYMQVVGFVGMTITC